LTNWYIRLSRRRFWKSQDDRDKAEAYATLYYVLVTFAKAAAPFIPFITEEIYRSLRTEDMPESVHLCDFPEPELFRRDEKLERQNALAQKAVSLGRFLRTQRSLKVRQPLARAVLVSIDPEVRELLALSEGVIADELNVKKVEIFGDEESLVHLSAKANFKSLGSRLGPKMKAFAAEIAKLSSHVISSIMAGTPYEMKLEDGATCLLGASDIVVNRAERPGFCVAADASLTIALDTELTPELLAEGYARELVSRIQNLRKEMGLQVSDRICVRVTAAQDLLDALESGRDRVCAETLAANLEFVPAGSESLDGDLNGKPCGVEVRKA
ncbi:MAG: class I tRNA ligase family protein, partial [Lentisphaeria bacterium]|nr:class I tRNA ligase family protein [Lentisphaeria bacterium]